MALKLEDYDKMLQGTPAQVAGGTSGVQGARVAAPTAPRVQAAQVNGQNTRGTDQMASAVGQGARQTAPGTNAAQIDPRTGGTNLGTPGLAPRVAQPQAPGFFGVKATGTNAGAGSPTGFVGFDQRMAANQGTVDANAARVQAGVANKAQAARARQQKLSAQYDRALAGGNAPGSIAELGEYDQVRQDTDAALRALKLYDDADGRGALAEDAVGPLSDLDRMLVGAGSGGDARSLQEQYGKLATELNRGVEKSTAAGKIASERAAAQAADAQQRANDRVAADKAVAQAEAQKRASSNQAQAADYFAALSNSRNANPQERAFGVGLGQRAKQRATPATATNWLSDIARMLGGK